MQYTKELIERFQRYFTALQSLVDKQEKQDQQGGLEKKQKSNRIRSCEISV